MYLSFGKLVQVQNIAVNSALYVPTRDTSLLALNDAFSRVKH